MTDGTKRHTVTFAWEYETPEATIQCPWEPGDPERPCRMFDDWESETPEKPIEGCGLREHLDAGGYEAVGILATIQSPPVPVDMHWNDYPEIGPVSD